MCRTRSGHRRRSTTGMALGLAVVLATGLSTFMSATSGASRLSPRGAAKGSALTIAVVQPFTGTTAPFGPPILAACDAASRLVNEEGGINGHTLNCAQVDTRGDSVDAVPAVDKLMATSGASLIGVLGPSSATAYSVVPIFNNHHIVMFSDAGQAKFDRTKYNYFWDIAPPDSANGSALAAWAVHEGYKKVAAVFSSGTTTATEHAAAVAAFRRLGGRIVANVSISENATSYTPQVLQVIRSKPQAIFYGAGAQTSATFFSELESEGGGNLPVIGPQDLLTPQMSAAIRNAIGASNLAKHFTAIEAPVASTAGLKIFQHSIEALKHTFQGVKTDAIDPFVIAAYDGAVTLALAAQETKAGTGSPKIENAVAAMLSTQKNQTTVDSFAAGKAALEKGKRIRYAGGMGKVSYSPYHIPLGTFLAAKVEGSGKVIGKVPSALLLRAEG
jgi:ABC-type branched-subunit amino acid transport system substrate-binding protein